MSRWTRRDAASETVVRILDVAQHLAQTRGFNGFSYADIAAQLGVTKASLHYHFASKAELGCALIRRYTQRFCAVLSGIRVSDAEETLHGYVAQYQSLLVRDELCLCGMFAAERATLPVPMQTELRRFFDKNEEWLAETLENGRANGLKFEGRPLDAARTLTAGLQGAMLLSRACREPARFAEIAAQLLSGVGVAPLSAIKTTRLKKNVRA